MDQLATYLENTLSADQRTRTDATTQLSLLQRQSSYGVLLLQLIANNSMNTSIRQSAAIIFKNYINKYWDVDADEPSDVHINESDRTIIKDNIVNLMIACTIVSIQVQISAALSIICRYDFPNRWEKLLPDLLSKITSYQASDYSSRLQLNSVLSTLNSIFQHYRYDKAADPLWLQIKYVLEQSQEILTQLLQTLCADIPTQINNRQNLNTLFISIYEVLNIFLSLNTQDIPEYFEDNIGIWMNVLIELLSFKSDLLDSNVSGASDSDSAQNVEDSVHSCICDIITLYTQKYEEQFKDYVPKFVNTVWTLLTNLSDDTRYDQLVTSAIKFLTVVVRKDWYKQLFSNTDALNTLCHRVIIPQIKLRDSDVELFSDDSIEYVRRDMEGSDVDTRRRMTIDFVRGICTHFENEITSILMNYIQSLLQQYQSNPADNYLLKDAAIYIVLALATKGRLAKTGVTQINQSVGVDQFIQTQIIPELQSNQLNSIPIIKADCIKFISEFRSTLPATTLQSTILPLIMRYLKSDDYVVYTYAALTIERILAMRGNDKQSIISKELLQPHLQELLISLFSILDKDDSSENDYVMKCIMRVCNVAQDTMTVYAGIIIQKITAKLSYVAQNPKNPNFNHNLFETIAALIQYICRSQPSSVQAFESSLFPIFTTMLSIEFSSEFHSYVFQLLSQLLEFNTEITSPFQSIFVNLLTPSLYENLGNIPALTRLLTAYLAKSQNNTTIQSKYEQILGIFQTLLTRKSTDIYALQLLNGFIHYVSSTTIQQYLPAIMRLLFTKLQKSNPPFARSCIGTLSLLITQHGFDILIQSIESIQSGIFTQFYEKVWLANSMSVPDSIQRKYVICGLATILKSNHTLIQSLTIPTIQAAIRVCSGDVQSVNGTTNDADDLLDASEQTFSTTFARLVFSNTPHNDYLSNISSGKQLLLDVLRQPAYNNILTQLPQDAQQQLHKLSAN